MVHRMRTPSMVAAAALGVALAVPAAGQPRFWIGPPPAPGLAPITPDGTRHDGPRRGGHASERRIAREHPHQGPRPPGWHFAPYYYPHYDYQPYYDYEPSYDDEDDGDVVVVPDTPTAPPAEPAAPAAAAAVPAEQPPPDPRGEARFLPARGAAPGAAPGAAGFEIGQPLPPGLPQVTLDWRFYRLPEPPPGRIYVRIGRAVLLIEAASRIVESEVTPAAAGG